MAEGLDDIEMQVVVSESTEQPNSPLPPKPVISLDQVRPITHTVADVYTASDVTVAYTMMLER